MPQRTSESYNRKCTSGQHDAQAFAKTQLKPDQRGENSSCCVGKLLKSQTFALFLFRSNPLPHRISKFSMSPPAGEPHHLGSGHGLGIRAGAQDAASLGYGLHHLGPHQRHHGQRGPELTSLSYLIRIEERWRWSRCRAGAGRTRGRKDRGQGGRRRGGRRGRGGGGGAEREALPARSCPRISRTRLYTSAGWCGRTLTKDLPFSPQGVAYELASREGGGEQGTAPA